jgi:hypothetical protein
MIYVLEMINLMDVDFDDVDFEGEDEEVLTRATCLAVIRVHDVRHFSRHP